MVGIHIYDALRRVWGSGQENSYICGVLSATWLSRVRRWFLKSLRFKSHLIIGEANDLFLLKFPVRNLVPCTKSLAAPRCSPQQARGFRRAESCRGCWFWLVSRRRKVAGSHTVRKPLNFTACNGHESSVLLSELCHSPFILHFTSLMVSSLQSLRAAIIAEDCSSLEPS